jgi:hypothetical protein
MSLVNVLVQGAPVESAVGPVVEHVLEDKEDSDLCGHEPDVGERHLKGSHAKVAADGVEEPDEGGLAGEVGDEDDLGHLPDLGGGGLLVGLQLPLVEEGHLIDDEPRDAAAKVDDLVKDKRHQASSNDRVADPDVVACPQALKVVERVEVDVGVQLALRCCCVGDGKVLGDTRRKLVHDVHRDVVDGGHGEGADKGVKRVKENGLAKRTSIALWG